MSLSTVQLVIGHWLQVFTAAVTSCPREADGQEEDGNMEQTELVLAGQGSDADETTQLPVV